MVSTSSPRPFHAWVNCAVLLAAGCFAGPFPGSATEKRVCTEGDLRGCMMPTGVLGTQECMEGGTAWSACQEWNPVDAGRPAQLQGGHISVSPERCPFGVVPVNTAATCQITFRNTGTQEVALTEVRLAPASGTPFSLAATLVLPVNLPPGSTVTESVLFSPLAEVDSGAYLVVHTSLAAEPLVSVVLSGTGGPALPTAVAGIRSVNGQPFSGGTVITVMDDVVLTAENSQPSRGHALVGYSWELEERPAGSTAFLIGSREQTTGFRFGTGTGQTGVDAAGTYRARVTVTDDRGQINSAAVSFTVVPAPPPAQLHVQLTWESDVADVDLHLLRNGAAPFTAADDCYYETCKTGMNFLSWGTDPGNNPVLDVDDVCGYGPENITIQVLRPGFYGVGVHFFGVSNSSCSGYVQSSAQTATATVRIFRDGTQAGEFTRTVTCSKQEDYWTVARIDATGPLSVTAVDTPLSAGTHGACGSSGL